MRAAILPLLLLGAVACRPAAEGLTEERKQAITFAVEARDAEYWDAWRAADWDRGMSFYVDSPDFVWASSGVITFGLDALEALRPSFAAVASQTFVFRDYGVVVLAPDVAVVTATGAWAQTDTAGVRGPAQEFAWTADWVRRDGEWKIQVVHFSTIQRQRGAM